MIMDWSFIGMIDVEHVIVLFSFLGLFLLCPFATQFTRGWLQKLQNEKTVKFKSETATLRVAKEFGTIKKPECLIFWDRRSNYSAALGYKEKRYH